MILELCFFNTNYAVKVRNMREKTKNQLADFFIPTTSQIILGKQKL